MCCFLRSQSEREREREREVKTEAYSPLAILGIRNAEWWGEFGLIGYQSHNELQDIWQHLYRSTHFVIVIITF